MPLRDDIDRVFKAALDAVDPARAISRHLARDGDALRLSDGWSRNLGDVSKVVLVAVGKAAVPMARAVAPMVADKLARTVVVTKYGHADAAAPFAVIESAHPVPDENGLRAGQAVCEALSGLDANALVLACISGGASALMAAPLSGISLNTLRAINEALLRSGADIREMNRVRAAIDRLKGGGLARLAAPAEVVGLILSDVVGDPLDVIASGLTHDPRARNVLVGNNAQACAAAAEAARLLGYDARVVTTTMTGEARERGAEIARDIAGAKPRAVHIFGGETTVTIRGDGKGGRNQELALAATLEFDRIGAQQTGLCVAALGTDGTDGPTDAAGAFAFGDTLVRARALGLDAANSLDRNDSYNFFAGLGDLVLSGPTGTNVADVIVAARTSD